MARPFPNNDRSLCLPHYLLHRFVQELLMAPAAGALPVPAFHLLAIAGGLAIGIVPNKMVADFRNLLGGMATSPDTDLPEPALLLQRPFVMRRNR